MPRMVILHPRSLDGENHGLLVQHVLTLATLLRGRGWTVSSTDPLDPNLAQVVLPADVVVVQMLASPEVEAIVRTRRASRRPTVFELTDNFLGVGGCFGEGHLLASPLTRARLLHHAFLCDALQVYAPGLAELFETVNECILRFDPYVPIPDRLPPREPGFVVGWGGTRSHAADLAAIAPTVAAFCARHREVTFAYMGDLAVFRQHFGSLAADQTSVRPFGTHAEYLEFVARLNVGLAPLEPTPFNAGRTDTRFGTYAALGVAAVLKDGPVHSPHRNRARLFRNASELDAILEEMWSHPAEVAGLGARANAWARVERGAEALGDQRDRGYRFLLRHAPGSSDDPPWEIDAHPWTEQLPPRLCAARRLQPSEALQESEAILAQCPSYEQAQLLAADSLVALGRYEDALAYVEGLSPSPIYADLFVELQLRCARRVRPAYTDRLFARIASPVRRAQLAAHGSVLARSRRVLEHQPYDYFALKSAITWVARADPAAEELDDLFARACLVSPEDVPTERRPARLADFLPS